VKIGRIGCAI
jgi:hypothetical protein